MSTTPVPTALSEEAVREAVNRWSTGFLRVPYLGDKIFVHEIAPRASYTFRLQSQYEDRSVAPVSVPYHGGSVDNFGQPPGPWDVEVRTPKEFEERTETLALAHTERVAMCSRCAGGGRIDCTTCNASGRMNCPTCSGRGYLERQEARAETDANGQTVQRSVTVRNDCTGCRDGLVSCTGCSGNGRVTCPPCGGSGNVKTFDQLTVRFRHAMQDDVLDETDVPDEMIGGLKGDVVADRREARIDAGPGEPAAVEQRVRGMLQKSQALDERQSRLLFQHLHVERVPVHEVRYMYAGVERRLWVCGHEKQVHAPDAPWRRGRMFALVGGIVGGLLLLALLLFLFLR